MYSVQFKKKKVHVIVLVFSVLIFLALRSVGPWMMLSDPLPDKLDILFTFGGEGARDLYSAELIVQYSNAQWLISSHVNKDVYVNRYWSSNNDTMDAYFVDTCTDTRSEILFLNKWLLNNKSNEHIVVGLVSGPYHMRRISILVNLYLQEKNVSFKYLPVPNKYYGGKFDEQHFSNWWRDRLLRSELLKMVREGLLWLF